MVCCVGCWCVVVVDAVMLLVSLFWCCCCWWWWFVVGIRCSAVGGWCSLCVVQCVGSHWLPIVGGWLLVAG